MTRGSGIYDDESADEPKGGRPGPKDEGKEGGMATREIAPDVAESCEETDGLTPVLSRSIWGINQQSCAMSKGRSDNR